MKTQFKSICMALFTFALIFSMNLSVNAAVVNDEVDVTVTTDKDNYKTNEIINYNINLNNKQAKDVYEINVKAKIPEGLTIVNSGTELKDNELLWNVDSLKANESMDIKFTAKVTATGSLPTTGERSFILVIAILLVAIGALLVVKSKKSKKAISILLIGLLLAEASGAFTVVASASAFKINSATSKTVNVNNKAYTVDVEVTGGTIGDIQLKVNGNLKENRLVEFDYTSTEFVEKYPLLEDKTEFTVEPITEGIEQEDIKVIEEDNSALTQKVLFKKAGQYKVTVKLYNEKEESVLERIITIQEDMNPIADFSLETDKYSRDENGEATIKIKDASFSNDKDIIGKRTWKVRYDSNNDGNFEDEEFELISSENEVEPIFKTNKVGKYEVYLEVEEYFEDTVVEFITSEDYKKGNSTYKEANTKVFEVTNTAPTAEVSLEAAKKVDMVVTVDKADYEKINNLSKEIESLEAQLNSSGIKTKISTVSTSIITAQDTFAWKAYDHPNYQDAYGQKLENHITYDDKDIKMTGYTTVPFNDFLYVDDDNRNQKTFTFDMQRDRNNWHTMEGAGFLFNTTVDDESDLINGYAVLMTSGSVKVVRINNANLTRFRNGGYGDLLQYAGSSLTSCSISNTLEKHSFKIVVDPKSISVWDGENLIINDFKLPDETTGNGFGPITSHTSHYCPQVSYFTFNNIKMEAVSGQSLADALKNHKWEAGAERVLINLSDVNIDELKTSEGMGNVAELILSKDLKFYGLGNDNNIQQYQSLINSTSNSGRYYSNDNIGLAISEIQQELLDKFYDGDFSINQYVVKGEEVVFKDVFKDKENDPICELRWKYIHNNMIFDNDEGILEESDQYLDSPISVFDKVGNYSVKLSGRDNPVGSNDNLDEYRLWSDESTIQKNITVHRRPIVELDVEVSNSLSDESLCDITVTENSYDPDHESEADKGVVLKEIYWKNIKDSKWTEGEVPSTLPSGEDYLVLVKVKDKEGFYSEPKAKYFTTKR